MDFPKNQKIAILAGGPSCEREISLVSGKAVYEALKSEGLDVLLMDPAADFLQQLRHEGIRQVFLALHGTFGEDGTIQEMLEGEGIIYTGSGPLASALAFDKARAQRLFRDNGLAVPEFQIFGSVQPIRPEAIRLPAVVKPASSGSSVGVTLVFERNRIVAAAEEAFRYSNEILIEEYIEGRELTVGILGDRALPVVEIVPGEKFYDFKAKYQDSRTRYEAPAHLESAIAAQVQRLALDAFGLLGCRGMARADVILGACGPVLLEVNTIPGMTGKSLLPKAAKATVIEFAQLCLEILRLPDQKNT
ncbi:MAG: D-alanine--D-alanine ligase, partial [Candidatus Omnitrophota bacterium]